MQAKCLFILFLFVSSANPSFIDSFFDGVGDLVGDLGSGLIGRAKDAFEEAMNDFVNNDLRPLIEQIQALLDRDIQEVDDDVKALVANIENFVQNEVQIAFELAQKFADQTINEIEQKIVDRTFQDLNLFAQTIFEDLNSLLDRIEQIEQKFICTEIAVIDEILQFVQEEIGASWWIIDPFDPCRESVAEMFPDFDLRWKFFSDYTPEQLYFYTKCTYINPLNIDSPIGEIKQSYLEWETLAAHMRCGATALDNEDQILFYLKEMGEASRRYHIWDSDGAKPKHLKALGPNCTTPLECFEEAYNLLIQAQKDIQYFKDLAFLANTTATSASQTANAASQTANAASQTANAANQTAINADNLANQVNARTILLQGECIVLESNGLKFCFQGDGNFVLYTLGNSPLYSWGYTVRQIQQFQCPSSYELARKGQWASFGCIGQITNIPYCQNVVWVDDDVGLVAKNITCTSL